MLALGLATKIHLAAGTTDLRKGMNGLHALIEREHPGQALGGHLFIFCNRRRDTIKVFIYDGTGLWLCAKRLEKGTYHWPKTAAQPLQLTHPQLQLLLNGIDLANTKNRNWWSPLPQK